MTLHLVPTVEFEPSEWASDEFLQLISPIVPGSWCVPVDALSDSSLLDRLVGRAIARIAVERITDDTSDRDDDDDHEQDSDREYLDALSGGYALLSGADGVVVLPSCCCDLGDLNEWRRVANVPDGEWCVLSVGHARWSAQREGVNLVLREEPEQRGLSVRTNVVLVEDLRAAAVVAEESLRSFADRLRPVIQKWIPDPARARSVALLLAGSPTTTALDPPWANHGD